MAKPLCRFDGKSPEFRVKTSAGWSHVCGDCAEKHAAAWLTIVAVTPDASLGGMTVGAGWSTASPAAFLAEQAAGASS